MPWKGLRGNYRPELKLLKFTRSKLIFLGLVALALALRAVYFSQTAGYLQPTTGSDGYFYLMWAESIVRGNIIGTEVFYALPAYPYFLATVYLFFGGGLFGLILTQICIGAINCGLIYVLGKRFFSNQVGIIASFIACGYFMFVFYDRMLLPATLAIFLGLLLALLLLKIMDDPTSRKWIGAGLLLGLCVLANASFLLLAVFSSFWIFYEFKETFIRQRLLHCISFVLAFSIIIGGATLRNYLVSKDTVFLTAHSGINFYIGNNPQANGLFKPPPYMRNTQSGLVEDARIFAEREIGGRLKPSEVSKFWLEKSSDFIKSQPFDYLKLLGKKFVLFCNGREFVDEIRYFIYSEEAKLQKFPLFRFSHVFPLAVLGMFISWPQRKRIMLLYLFVFSFTVASILFFINSRYRLAVVPYFIIFAGEAIWQIFQRLRSRKYISFIILLAVFFSLYFLSNMRLAEANVKKYNFTFHYNKGVIFSDRGNYPKAEQEFQTALELNPNDFLSYLGLGNVYYSLEDTERAVDNYQKALAINPYFYTAHFNLGIIYTEIERKNEAEKEFKKVLELKPEHCAAHYNLGRIYQERGLREPALEQYELGLEIEPRNLEILQAIGEIE